MSEFWGEAITMRSMAPLEAHVAVYIVMLHRNPSDREKELHTPPEQTPPSGGTPHCLQVELGDLDNHELHQLVEDLMQEIAQCKIHVPPSNPPPNEWVCPLGSRDPKEDDQEVTFPGGRRWGPPRQVTPPVEPEQPAGGRVPSGPPL